MKKGFPPLFLRSFSYRNSNGDGESEKKSMQRYRGRNQEGIQRERGKLRHNLIDRTISCCRKQAIEENARLCGVIGLIDFARDRESMN